ncbi:MAG: SsrA-binding protein SmpB [Deltaproteobacteria bacterium]|nr:SsrA-binding protein SmpB [Candidatus Zymogenaceae bacterium]
MKKDAGVKVVTANKKARADYFIEDTFEAGMALMGTEVKSLREGRANLKDSYAREKDGRIVLVGAHISPYPFGNRVNHEPERERQLLLHKQEIRRLVIKTRERGYTLVPLAIYFKNGRAKLEIGLGKGKAQYDKREAIKKREQDREMQRAIRGRGR